MCSMQKLYFLKFALLGVLPFVTVESSDSKTSSKDGLVISLVYPEGKIRGHALKSYNGLEYFAYQEIPYAKPPIGDLRYQVPQRHDGWEGILNTTGNTKICIQPGSTALPITENCLYLNVYTPVSHGSNANLSVYVWLHGGAYISWDGTISRYNPKYLIDYKVVIVTLNYRLGVLGFLATDDGVIPGNIGLRDQHMALKWVHENIHLFGGDPNKVTIGGESAGASAVGLHILSPMNRGLFRGAILESGSALNSFSYRPNPSIYAYQVGKLLNSSVNPETTTTTDLLDILKKADVNDILNASLNVTNVEPGGFLIDDLIWSPTLESQYKAEPFISSPMLASFNDGNFSHVPILLGFNSEEMLYFLPSSDTTLAAKTSTWEQFYKKLATLDKNITSILFSKVHIEESKRYSVASELKRLYTNTSFTDDGHAFIKISSDLFFSHGVIRQADLSSKYVPVYLYEFDYTANKSAPYPGTQHTEELKYLWQSVEDKNDINEFQTILRHRICKLWTNFVKYLNPTPKQDKEFDNIIWPKVRPNDLKYLQIKESFSVNTKPRRYSEVENILGTCRQKPFVVYI